MAHGHNAPAPDPASEHMASPHDAALLLADLVRAVAHMAAPRQGRWCALLAEPGAVAPGSSLAQRLLYFLHMGHPQARRCAIWVDTDTLMAAQELADLAGVDVDAFVEFVVKELHVQEAREGALHARAQASGAAPVIPINGERRRQRQRRRG